MKYSPSNHVIIVGGGFSGTLLAINLMRHNGPSATLIERRAGQIGRGVAYSATHPAHLLNVRAGNMSALPDDPGHLARWLQARGHGEAHSFVPRTLYGTYLREMLAEARERAGGRLRLISAEAVAAYPVPGGMAVELDNGGRCSGESLVLAIGNLPPHTPPGIDPDMLPPGCYAADPWSADIAEELCNADEVVLLGTGLTAIDATLLLDARGFDGRILAMSRRGLAPRHHASVAPPVGLGERPQGELSALVGQLRRRAGQAGWRAAVDELRPVTQMMWAAADTEMRARFLRHLRPFWDVHRHRLAPDVAERIDGLQAEGKLRFVAGKIVTAKPFAPDVELRWRPRHGDAVLTSRVRRIVNCTGPQGDLLRSSERLICQMLQSGQIRPDVLRLGLDVDARSRVIDGEGEAQDRLYCIGPMTRGGLWEVVAVPDLRRQSWDLARRLSNAHWVGGEGL